MMILVLQAEKSASFARGSGGLNFLFCLRCHGAPGVIRTPDLLVRSQTLYPTELRARRFQSNSWQAVFNTGVPVWVRDMKVPDQAALSSQ
jgi:hypothetical protein